MKNCKYKVLIVDDEFRIGALINKLIKWDDLELECIDILDNGESAYAAIIEKTPDIVITDIRMPKINGLDLICMTKEKGKEVKFIVISGYKEFEYAHRALQYGVNDYLLKPIDEEELNNVLRKIVIEIKKQEREQKELETMEKTVTISEHIIKKNVLNEIIEQGNIPSIQEMKENYNLSLNEEIYRGIDIKLDYWDYEKTDSKQDSITTERVKLIVEQTLNNCVKQELICEKENLHIYCLFNYSESKIKEVKNLISVMLSEIKEYLIRFEQYEVTIGIGSEEREFGKIRFSIDKAHRAVQNRIKVGTGRLIYADSIQLENQIDISQYIEPYKEQFLLCIDTYSKEALEQNINLIYGNLQFKEEIDFSCYYELAKKLIGIFFDYIEMKNFEGDQLKQFLLNMSEHCYTIAKMKNILKEYLGEYLQVCLKLLETESTKPIRQAKQYIDGHFSEKIVLEDIAQIVDLNPVYFSVLFKKETGFNFSVYLVNVRMEAAKEMIRNGNETIAAIAEGVGYKDTRYFSQLFTKIVGIKPALYRKLHS